MHVGSWVCLLFLLTYPPCKFVRLFVNNRSILHILLTAFWRVNLGGDFVWLYFELCTTSHMQCQVVIFDCFKRETSLNWTFIRVAYRVFPKMLHRLSSGTYDTVSSIFSRLSQELDTSTLFHHDVRCESQTQETTTDEVKRALSFRIAKYRVDMNNGRASC